MRDMLGPTLLVLVGVGDPLTVHWEAPADRCAPADEVRDRLHERLGPRLEEHTRVEVDGRVTAYQDRLRLRLRVTADDEITERELEAPVCEELLDAALLIASLTVGGEPLLSTDPLDPREPPTDPPSEPLLPEPESSESQPEPQPVEPQPVPPPEPAPPPEIPEQPSPTRPLQGSARLGAGAAWGQLPGVGAILTAGAGLNGPRWTTRLDLTYAPRRRALVPGFADRGAFIQAWHVSLDGGLRWPLGTRVHLPATLGVDLGALHGRGFGVLTSSSRAQPWIALAASLGVDVRLTARIGLWAAARLGVPMARPAFEIEGRGTVFRVERVSPRAAAGLMITFQ